MRDAAGIPHIYAQDKHDLLVAQGFVHAQDRLWQMETLRRVATGRLAEIAGEARVNVDFFSLDWPGSRGPCSTRQWTGYSLFP
jgi:penicillin amidase